MLTRTHHRYAFTLALITLLGFAVRLYRLDGQSLWYDEGVTAMVAQLDGPALLRWTANDIQPPFYYLLVSGWGRLAGWSEFSLRAVSLFFGTLLLPLLAAMAYRLTRQRCVGLVVPLLAALHPLLVYYSQEARMYALLAALGVLAAYALLVAAETPQRRWPLAVYAVTAAMAAYTHYFALFLLTALSAAYLVDVWLWQARAEPRRAALVRILAANLAAVLFYLPWLGAMLNRFSVDNSYWQGRLKLGGALRNTLLSFVAGETMAQSTAMWLLALYALITAAAIWRLARLGVMGRRTLTYGLLWLALPVAATLALAMTAPKFNPRYVMIALPGLLLIWGAGLGVRASLLNLQGLQGRLAAASRAAAVIFLLLGSLWADVNWFTDPAFRKDQWRELAIDLRHNVQPHEAIVLVSGHAWPVWHYYAPDLPVVRLPAIDVLDVDTVLDFADTAAPIRVAVEPLAERPGVWLIGWQDEVVDPTQVVPVQLELAGREKGLSSRYWGIDLRRFSQLKPHWLRPEAPIAVPVDAVFGDQVILRGYTPGDSGELLLFWELTDANAPTAADYWMVGRSTDADGETVAEMAGRRLSDYRYPSFRWPQGRVVMGVVEAADWLGADPQAGRYTFEVHVYAADDPRATPLPLADGSDSLVLTQVEAKMD